MKNACCAYCTYLYLFGNEMVKDFFIGFVVRGMKSILKVADSAAPFNFLFLNPFFLAIEIF